MKKFLKKSDKGFSLVELIVVICIMAVLIGVIAPAFIKYVSKSKDSVMIQNVEELQRASNVVLVDNEFKAPTSELTIVISKGTASPSSKEETVAGNFLEMLTDSLGGEDKYPNDDYTYTIKVAAKGTSVSVSTPETLAAKSTATPSPTATGDAGNGNQQD